MTQPVPEINRRPKHVAVIMDGNGRWAADQGLSRLEGHKRGADVVREITTYARELGIEYLTLYSFSAQNWRRPPLEVAGLMTLLHDYCVSELPTLMKNDIRLSIIGDLSRFPPSTRAAVKSTMDATHRNRHMTLTLALDYGGREELVKAMKLLAADVEAGRLEASDITEKLVAARLDTSDMPDPDLVIRTSGEKRVSNFLLWQLAYAELHFTDVRWPDFSRADFAKALAEYASRDRRFGAVTSADAKSAADNRQSALGDRSSEVGDRQSALGDRSSAIGDRQSAVGDRSSAVGDRQSAVGDRSSAVGDRPSAVDDSPRRPVTFAAASVELLTRAKG